jgi:hypothetical protein
MKVIILVQSVDKPEYIKLRETQQQTWDSIYHPNIETFYYKPNSQTEEIIDNTINTPENENWINMYKSFVKALRLLINQNFDYIFKTDNSTYVDKKVLYNILSTKPRNNYFGGMIYPYESSGSFIWGEGFVISKDIAQYLVDEFNKAPFLFSGLEDVVISNVLKDKTQFDDTLHVYEINSNNIIEPGHHLYRVRLNHNQMPTSIVKPENLSEIIDSDIKSMYNIHNIITNGKSNNINSN